MQNLSVAVIVLYAAWVVLRKYLPKALRRVLSQAWLRLQLRGCASLAAIMRACGMPGLGRRLQAAMQRRAERAALHGDSLPEAGSCGGCDGCSSNSGGKPAAADDKPPAANAITPDALRRTIRRRA